MNFIPSSIECRNVVPDEPFAVQVGKSDCKMVLGCILMGERDGDRKSARSCAFTLSI